MDENGGHIHVDAKVVREETGVRGVLAATFGLVGDLPSAVTTGCGVRVPYAMTSWRPESVTCLPCREHARREHLRFAEQVTRLAGMPGAPVDRSAADRAAARHRDLARRFSDS
ncbi:hypothetical protein [Streptomyces sp. NPDC046862]|uniref:hypothetical protein n=1 Tax=Streptomyces sp. NPDC046862 TaxID=3154603 RepID=UPI00345241F2